MDSCIFCKIVKKEIPAEIVYEDENFLAFLDIHPQSAGHTQIIPKKHYRFVWDLPADEAGGMNTREYFAVAQKIAKAQQKAFGTDIIWSKVMGDEIFHAHIWVFPNPHEAKGPPVGEASDPKNLKENAEKLRLLLS